MTSISTARQHRDAQLAIYGAETKVVRGMETKALSRPEGQRRLGELKNMERSLQHLSSFENSRGAAGKIAEQAGRVGGQVPMKELSRDELRQLGKAGQGPVEPEVRTQYRDLHTRVLELQNKVEDRFNGKKLSTEGAQALDSQLRAVEKRLHQEGATGKLPGKERLSRDLDAIARRLG